MDPITQGLIGAAAAQAVFHPQLGRKAALIGMVGGILPDADVFIRSAEDPLLAVEHHRGFTHALAFIPVGGAVASLPWLIREKNRHRWKPVVGAAIAGYATHGLLDACTTYGTQLLWPFSSDRVAWNIISIVDPVFTSVLLVGVVTSAWMHRRWPAVAALALCLAYLGIGTIQKHRALDVQRSVAEARGHEPPRRAVFPTIANLIVWRSLYQGGDSLHVDRIRVPFFAAPAWQPGSSVPHLAFTDLDPALRQSPRAREDFRRFTWFSGGWVARAPDDPQLIGDARYSLRTDSFDPIWGIRFERGDPMRTEWIDATRDRDLSLSDLWAEITGKAPYRRVP